jgi:Mg2+/Co2+ transporter CorC
MTRGNNVPRSLVKASYCVREEKNEQFIKRISNWKRLRTMTFVKDKNNNITGMVTLEDMLEEVASGVFDEY